MALFFSPTPSPALPDEAQGGLDINQFLSLPLHRGVLQAEVGLERSDPQLPVESAQSFVVTPQFLLLVSVDFLPSLGASTRPHSSDSAL